ncbi:DUF547 domain-containing protein [Polaribacter sp.]|uniref:DUF547 domain-containing protein n=1 Tax=Polaribacter sp. TaxID=1920175 RepID=UPI0025FBD1F7|nr:DUF547 domain-containing protein [Polaribacter sp.]
MKKIFTLLFALISFLEVKAQTSIFSNLLEKHVTSEGVVDYAAFKADEVRLDIYLTYLENTNPDKSWSKSQQKAFWMNAYNAYTIKLILENYPINSIMDIKKDGKSAWKIPFAKVGRKTYTLNYIEHEILRKQLFDPRIHVGVNCASISCPKILNKVFTAGNIDTTLEILMKEFINDSSRNKIGKKYIQISSIFDWFQQDFTKNGSVIDYLNNYTEFKINAKANISYLKYDWGLNSK